MPNTENEKLLHNYRLSIARTGMLMLCMQDLAVRIGKIANGDLIRSKAEDIRSETLLGLKVSSIEGLSYEDQAKIMNKALNELDGMISFVFDKIEE